MSFFAELKHQCSDEWCAYTSHPFVLGLGDGTLPESAFRTYLAQDYLFLIDFARAYALAVLKAPTLAGMRRAAATMQTILDVEMDLHVTYAAQWDLTAADLEATAPRNELLAYTRFVLDTGMRGDVLDLEVALAPCIVGYAEIAAALAARKGALAPANPYARWIAEYAGDAYQELAADAVASLDQLARDFATPARLPALVQVFRHATNLETAFWQMALES